MASLRCKRTSAASPQARWRRLLKIGIFLCLVEVSLASAALQSGATFRENFLSTGRTAPSAAKRWVDKFCPELTKTKRISFVKELISNLELLDSDGRPAEQAHGLWFFRAKAHGSGQPCTESAAAILELKPIIKEQHNVCSKKHLDVIENYYKKHIKSGPTNLINSMVGTRPVTEHFFMLYAKQVSHKCKKSMLKTLGQVESTEVVTEADFERALPWIRDSSVIDACNTNNPFASNQWAQRESKHRCKAMSVISGIKNIGELALLLKSPDALLTMNKLGEQPVKMESEKSVEESAQDGDHQNGLIIVVPPNRMQMISDLTSACIKFKPIYENTVLPVVRLAHMGASTEFKDFDRACLKRPLMKKWFGLTLVCETILKSRLAKSDEKYEKLLNMDQERDDVFVVYDEFDDKQTDFSALEGGMASHEESELEPLRRVTNTLDDELWIHKYKTTALQRLKENMKLFSIDDVQSHIVFVQKTANIRRWIGRGVVTALLTAAINNV